MEIHLKPYEKAPEYLTETILKKLNKGQKVLWFVTGGSSIKIASKVSKKLAGSPMENLTVMLTDERYGPVGHPNSNWQGLMLEGFELLKAKLIPILSGKNMEETAKDFALKMQEEFPKAEYKIGLFGVGADGHTAGILPESKAFSNETLLATCYHTQEFDRITMTPDAIDKLDEAVVCMHGKEKWPVVKDLLHENKGFRIQPAQLLKRLKKLTIFSDYQYE
ncbi:hypothetical protein A2914_00375 [Candidatus Nomurabacteria bacterium RIFCSPLOWO2_01_FULL_41_21]|uniref:Glucosamine/galactosamine-6-phosphate isomerase domain-containing protein n=2 Tax=Candidatus Nomuraibacteriota TaxID=1752729 RepID=A0A1F6V3X0_9BACT|nr:MAG: hypothetical protein A2733_02780 [Candidatus Nomurabacteria bacterium RIFCSPHIGHO2_01_FULL_40_20]OGI88808.1 MAG: hypothetical protein A2914_00375 [Candidatus Nomurabacteria bacterium RIFCSPLOWO2_01_FULL_41_21]